MEVGKCVQLRLWDAQTGLLDMQKAKLWSMSFATNSGSFLKRFEQWERDYHMARGKGKASGTAKQAAQFTTYVNFRFPPEYEGDMREQFPDNDSVFQALETVLQAGYRVGFSHDFQRGSYICSLTCRDDESVNAGKTMSSFASWWVDALRVALYKHYFLLEMDWGKAESELPGSQLG